MNLGRAKSILILTFLALNLFLFYQLWQGQWYGGFTSFRREEEITRMELALENAGLSLQVNLPKGTLPMAYMLVEPWLFDPYALINEIWGIIEDPQTPLPSITIINNEGSGMDVESEKPSTDFSFGDDHLRLSQNGLAVIRLEIGGRAEKSGRENIDEYLREIRESVGKLSFYQGFISDYIVQEENEIISYSIQEYENYPLYTRYPSILFTDHEAIMMQFYRLDIIGFGEQKREIIPSTTALLRFLERYEGTDAPAGITGFTLGYYAHEYDAERWEIPPVWRIRLSSGEIYYINAFTGNPEN